VHFEVIFCVCMRFWSTMPADGGQGREMYRACSLMWTCYCGAKHCVVAPMTLVDWDVVGLCSNQGRVHAKKIAFPCFGGAK
jgi:hypothetical protein